MGFALLIIFIGIFIGVIFGGLKNGEKGAKEYGQVGAGCSLMFLQFFQLISPLFAILFVIYLIVKGCSN